jgi:hypothetical protein
MNGPEAEFLRPVVLEGDRMNRSTARVAVMGLVIVGMMAVPGGGRPLAANPCAAKDPCAAKPVAANDPVAEAAFKQYKEWKKVNTEPVLSASHGNRYVFTYLNKIAEPSGLRGNFPFSKGAVLAKESFETQDGKPGPQGPLFIMEKRGEGYDRAHANWHYAVVDPSDTVSLSGSGHEHSPTQFCSACHAMAKANDYVFGNGTIMKVKPTASLPCRREEDQACRKQRNSPDEIEIDPAAAQEGDAHPLINDNSDDTRHSKHGEGMDPDRGQCDPE